MKMLLLLLCIMFENNAVEWGRRGKKSKFSFCSQVSLKVRPNRYTTQLHLGIGSGSIYDVLRHLKITKRGKVPKELDNFWHYPRVRLWGSLNCDLVSTYHHGSWVGNFLHQLFSSTSKQ